MSHLSVDWPELSLQVMMTFGHFLWQGCLLALLLVISERLLAFVWYAKSSLLPEAFRHHESEALHRTANFTYTTSCTAFFTLPLCVAITFVWVHQARGPILLVAEATATQAIPIANSSVPTPKRSSVELPPLPPVVHSGRTEFPAARSPETRNKPSTLAPWTERIQPYSYYLLIAYAIVVCIMLGRFGLSIIGSSQMRNSRRPIADSNLLKIVAQQAARLGLKHAPAVALCERVSVPVVIGIVRPIILLPPALMCGLAPNQIGAVLSHEMAHIRRYDPLINALQRIVEALLFFHPVTWWMSHRISVARENCCDDIAAGSDRLEYAAALLRMAEQCTQARGLNLAPQLESLAADGGSTSQLGVRIKRLLGESQVPRLSVTRGAIATIAISTLLGAFSLVAFAQFGGNDPTKNHQTKPIEQTTDNENNWGEESHGLRCRIVPVSPSMDAEQIDMLATQSRFASPETLAFAVEVQNVSDKAIFVQDIRYGDGYAEKTRGKLNANHYGPHLFDFTFTDRQGNVIARTKREFVIDSHAMILRGAMVTKLDPKQSLKCLLQPAKFERSMRYRLPPGDYRVQVSYRGPSQAARDWIKTHNTGQDFDRLWASAVSSKFATFSVAAEGFHKPDLVWGQETDGLQAALEIRAPSEAGIPTRAPGVLPATSLRPILHVKNVSDVPITFVSETGRQGDTLKIKNANGNPVDVKDMWFSGWPIDVRWTLQPGDVAQLDVRTPSPNQGLAPGKYFAMYTVRFNSRQQKDGDGKQIFPAPGDYDREIDTGWTPLLVRDPRQPIAANERNDGSPAPPKHLKESFLLPEHRRVGRVAFLADEQSIVSLTRETAVDRDGLDVRVRTWNLVSKTCTKEVDLEWQPNWTQYVSNLLLSHDGARIVGLLDGQIAMWDASTGKITQRHNIADEIKNDKRYSVRLSNLIGTPDLSRIAFGRSVSLGGTAPSAHAFVMDTNSGTVLQKVKMEHRIHVQSLALSTDGSLLATVGSQNGASIWDVETGKLVLDFHNNNVDRKHPNPTVKTSSTRLVSCVGFSPDGNSFAVCDMLGIKLLDVKTGKVLKKIDAPYRYHNANSKFIFSADGQLFTLLGTLPEHKELRTIGIWSTASGERLRTLAIDATTADFSADGRWFAAGKSDRKHALVLWQIREDKQAESSTNENVNGIEETDSKLTVRLSRGEDGRPVSHAYLTLWRALRPGETAPANTVNGSTGFGYYNPVIWNDTQHNARWIRAGSAHPNDGRHSKLGADTYHFESLKPGRYRVTAMTYDREAKTPDPTPYGVSGPIIIDGNTPAAIDVELHRGDAKLTVVAVDAETQQPIEGLAVRLRTSGGMPIVHGHGSGNFFEWTSSRGTVDYAQLLSGDFLVEILGKQAQANQFVQYEPQHAPLRVQVKPGRQQIEVPIKPRPLLQAEIDQRFPFSAFGSVTDTNGNPMPNVVVRAATGMGTLRGGGQTKTDANGEYRLYFGPGMRTRVSDDSPRGVGVQAAHFYVDQAGWKVDSKDGYLFYLMTDMTSEKFNERLKHEGGKIWGKTSVNDVIFEGQPRKINIMLSRETKGSLE